MDADHPEGVSVTPVLDTDRWNSPASNKLTGRERLLGSIELSSGKLIDHLEDPPTELLGRAMISLGKVSDDRIEILFRFG